MDFELNLDSETVEQAHLAAPICVDSSATVREVIGVLQAKVTGAAIVCEGDKLIGIFTERDLLKLLANDADLDQPVINVMAKNPQTLTRNDSVGNAIERMFQGGFRRMPVIDRQGKVTAMLKVSGILNYLVDHFPKVIYTLPPDPHYKPNDREGA